MSVTKLIDLTRDNQITVSIGILIVIFIATIKLTFSASALLHRFDLLEESLSDINGKKWEVSAEREAWREAERLNPGFISPNITNIMRDLSRVEYSPPWKIAISPGEKESKSPN